MYIEEWIKTVEGKGFDIDKAYGVQCVDGWDKFLMDYDIPIVTTGNGWANGLWLIRREYFSKWFDLIYDKNALRDGDWVIWNKGKNSDCPKSHVAMYWGGKFFGQSPSKHKYFAFSTIGLRGFLGAFRPKFVQARPQQQTKTVDELAHEVIEGKWGNGVTRQKKLLAEGYDYKSVQARVNEILLEHKKKGLKSIHAVALEVINGKWGNGSARKKKLESAGYDYKTVQSEVNRIIRAKK